MMLPTKLHTMESRITPSRKRSTSNKRGAAVATTGITVRSSSLQNNNNKQNPYSAYRTPAGQIKPILKPLQRSQSSNQGVKLRNSSKENSVSHVVLAQDKSHDQVFEGTFKLAEQPQHLDTEMSSQFGTMTTEAPTHLELAKIIFEKAVKKYGVKMNHRQVDSLIKRSELKDQVDRSTRKRLKSLIYNYERNGFNAAKAIKLEVVKVECGQLARNHHRNILLSKAMCSLIHMIIERGRQDPVSSFKSFASGENTTLNRMLEGVITTSQHSQLEEFVQIERSLETEESETLISEPSLVSGKKPPSRDGAKEVPNRLHQKAQADSKKMTSSDTATKQRIISGIHSPSMQDLQGEFQAFCDENSNVDSQKMLLQSTLKMTSILSKDALPFNQTFDQTKMATTSFILGRNGTLGRPDDTEQPETTHLKIAQLFKTNPMSSVETTQIDDQIKRLDMEPFSDDEDDDTSVEEMSEAEGGLVMANYAFRQSLLRKGFKAWFQFTNAKIQSKKQRTATFNTKSSRQPQPQLQPKISTENRNKSRDSSKNKKAVTKKTVVALKSKVVKVEEEEVPVKQQVQQMQGHQQRNSTGVSEQTYQTAPKIQSCMSSPMTRLRSILTDKETSKAIYSHMTSRRQSPSRSQLGDQWQTQDSRHMLHLEQSGIRLRSKSLKRQAFKCLEYSLHLAGLKMRNAEDFYMRRVLTHLRQLVFKRKKQRSIMQLYEESRKERLVVQTFRNWRGRYFEAQIVSQFRKQSLLKCGFEVLLQGTIHVAQARQISIVCRQHFKGRLLNRILMAWGHIASNNQVKRNKRKAIVRHMQMYQKARVVKEWFNKIDLLKHEQAAQRDLLASRVKRLKRNFFVVWLNKYCKIEKRRQIHAKLATYNQENFAKRYFGPWLSLTRQKMQKKDKFFRLRALHLYQKAFYGLKENLYSSNGDRQRTRRIVLLRASRLIKTAFYDGFIANRSRKEHNRRAKVIAQNHNQSVNVVRAFKALAFNHQRGRKAKTVKSKMAFYTTSQLFVEWITLTKNVQKAKKLRTKILIERQFQVIKALYDFANRSKIHKTIIDHCIKAYSQRLIRTALSSFSENIIARQTKRDIMGQLSGYYLGRVQSKAIHALRANNTRCKAEAKLLFKFRGEQEDRRVDSAFSKLKSYRILQLFKRSYKPLVENKQMWTKEQCFVALRAWKTNKKEQKARLSDYLSYKQGGVLENTFENLMAYTHYSKIQKQRNADAKAFMRKNLLAKAIQTLIMHKICKDNQKELTRGVEKIRRKILFVSWFNHVHDDVPAMKKADDFYLRHKFTAIRTLAVNHRSLRARRTLLSQLSAEYYPYMLKKRGVLKWQRVADRKAFVKQSLESFQLYKLRKLFEGWNSSTDRLREGNCRYVMQVELNKRFQYRRVLTALQENADKRMHTKEIVRIFQAKHNMVEKARVFGGLIEGNLTQKIVGKEFAAKMQSFAKGIIGEAFSLWKANLTLARKDDMASLYQEHRATKFILRKFFDKLKVGGTLNTKKYLKDNWLEKVHNNALLRTCFTNLALYTQTQMKLNHAWGIATARTHHRLKILAFNSLAGRVQEKARLGCIEEGLMVAFNKVRQRKALIALKSYTARQVRAKIVSEKWALRNKSKFLCRWQDQMNVASKMNKMCSILQDQSYLKFIRAFMLKLEDAGHYMVFRRELNKRLMSKALSVLRQKWLLSKMSNSLFKKHEIGLQRSVLMALRFNQVKRINLRETVEQQAELQNEEDDFDMKRACFEQLKQIRFRKMASRVARGTFGLGALRKAFNSLLQWNLKQKVLKVNYNEIVILRKQRILHKWLGEFDKKQREHEAGAIIKFDRVHQVMQAWKKYTHDEKLVRQFRAETYETALKRTLISSLQKNFVIQNFQRMMADRIQKRQSIELKKDAMKALRAGTKLSSIQQRMMQFYLHQFKKKVIKGWRSEVDKKNFHRISLIRQRAAFQDRPYLAKPLLAWRNLLMFKAFRSIMLNANRRKEFAFNKQICTYSIYLRLQRKAFYALRLNAAARYQKKKSKEIKRLMIQRRWFTYLKRVIQGIKLKRKQNTDAAIFRFLSLQRRGFIQWIDFVSKMKRVAIKRHFAMTLYYNRMCDKVFTAMKVNAKVKQRKRKELSQDSGYITTSSSEIMHEASFTHRTKLNMSSLQQISLQQIVNTSSSHNLLQNFEQINQALDKQLPIQLYTKQEPAHLQEEEEDQEDYTNFYQKPINMVEKAQLKIASQECFSNLHFNELSQLELADNQRHLLLQNNNSLPTPPGHDQNHIMQHFNQFNGDINHPQQLTLGTGPELNQLGGHASMQQHQESQQTQQWQTCQLCVQGVQHEHIEEAPYQIQRQERPYDSKLETQQQQQQQQQQYIMPEMQDQLSSFLEYHEGESSQASLVYEPPAVYKNEVQMVPERDYSTVTNQLLDRSHGTNNSSAMVLDAEPNYEIMMAENTPMNPQRQGQYQQSIQEAPLFSGDDTDQSTQQQVNRVINMSNLANFMIPHQSQEESKRTTPEMYASPNIEMRRKPQQVSGGRQSGVYSHASSLKTTPGMVRTAKRHD